MAGRTASKLSTQQASGRARHRVLLLACAAQTCKLALLLLAGALLPDYDTSASLRPFSCFPESAQQVSQQGSRSPSTQHAADSTGRAGHALPHWSQPAWSLVVWDSVFYADIACGGYRFEQQYAFFPLLPALLRPWRAQPAVLPWAGLLLSLVCSSLAAVLLHELTQAVTRSRRLADLAALVFIFSPTGVFTAAIYTEPLFACLSFLGLCILYVPWPSSHTPSPCGYTTTATHTATSLSTARAQEATYKGVWESGRCVEAPVRLLGASLVFAVASCVRSNGIIHAGFILHAAMQAALTDLCTIINHYMQQPLTRTHTQPTPPSIQTTTAPHHPNTPHTHSQSSTAPIGRCISAVSTLWVGAIGSVSVAAPLVLHQLHAHALLCPAHVGQANPALQPDSVGAGLRAVMNLLWAPALKPLSNEQMQAIQQRQGLGLWELAAAVDAPEWCVTDKPPWWPAMYGYVQRQYWDVGFLRYWRLSQVPNFLLAAPVLLVASSCIISYLQRHWPHMLRGGWAVPLHGDSATVAPPLQSHPVTVLSLTEPHDNTGVTAGQDAKTVQVEGRGAAVPQPQPQPQPLLQPQSQPQRQPQPAKQGAPAGGQVGAGSGEGVRRRRSARLQGKGGTDSTVGAPSTPTPVRQDNATLAGTAEAPIHTPVPCKADLGDDQTGFYSEGVAVFIYPLAFMVLTALFVMHVQVSTRFLSSSPALYWHIAHILQHPSQTRPAVPPAQATGGQAQSSDNPLRPGGQAQLNQRRTGRAHKGKEPRSSALHQGTSSEGLSQGQPDTHKAGLDACKMVHENMAGMSTYGTGSRASYWFWVWAWGYTLVGTTLFVNFLPWT